MHKKSYLELFLCLFLILCFSTKKTFSQTFEVKLDSANWIDNTRNRTIPVAFYSPKTYNKIKHQKVVIMSHGYGQNKGGDYLAYSYLTENLASKGYFVVSIQHELPTDSLLPMTGKPQIVRRSNWERGVANILFVIQELKKSKPALDFKHLTLIGHSNGGDMSMLFAQKYPNLLDKVISLDNRRVDLPRTKKPKIYSIRSSDQAADEGVLPTLAEQAKFRIKIIKLPNTIHNDMDDGANEAQRKEINDYLELFLKN